MPAKGTHGQQLHFIIWYRGQIAGIISGASAAFATAPRDRFFKITKENRIKVLNGIVDNVVFRLINHESNLGTKVLSLWEKTVCKIWERLYGVKVFGLETFIVREGLMREIVTEGMDVLNRPIRRVEVVEDPEGNLRRGNLYRAANWVNVGETFGNTKGHDGVGLTGGKKGGKGYFLRKQVPIKDIYCRWVAGTEPIESNYLSSWKAATQEGTPEEKGRAKERSRFRMSLIGSCFYLGGKTLFYENVQPPTGCGIKWDAPQAPRETRINSLHESSGALA